MNIVLFEQQEIGLPLPRTDPRAVHVARVLKRRAGDSFDAGIVNGPRGRASIVSEGPEGMVLRFEAVAEPPPADPIHLLVALPRPQTARRILSEATSLGAASIRFFASEKAEPSYASSSLWSSGEWRRLLVAGAAQAFDTRIPAVLHGKDLAAAIAALPAQRLSRIALDNYEAAARLGPLGPRAPAALAFGPERGWSSAERSLLRAERFQLAHLGPRVLRLETAIIAAMAVVKSPG